MCKKQKETEGRREEKEKSFFEKKKDGGRERNTGMWQSYQVVVCGNEDSQDITPVQRAPLITDDTQVGRPDKMAWHTEPPSGSIYNPHNIYIAPSTLASSADTTAQ
jgi:hypothetical protein